MYVMNEAKLKSILPRLGAILKLYREKTGQIQGDIAAKAGISVSMLSQIERGVVSPSIDTLFLVCEALKLDAADLFKRLSSERPVRVHRPSERLTNNADGVRYEQLMTSSDSPYQIELCLLDVAAGQDTMLSSKGHEGIEMGYVMSGNAILTVDGDEYALQEGDSVFFNSNLPHRLRNESRKVFRAIWSITPPHMDYLG